MTQKTPYKKIEKKDVEKLAALARITIPENEIEKVRADMEVILAYVGQIDEANDLSDEATVREIAEDAANPSVSVYGYHSNVRNVMREDGEPHESGIFTEALLKSAPKSDRGSVEVKKILN